MGRSPPSGLICISSLRREIATFSGHMEDTSQLVSGLIRDQRQLLGCIMITTPGSDHRDLRIRFFEHGARELGALSKRCACVLVSLRNCISGPRLVLW